MAVWLCPGQGAQQPGMGADLLADARFTQVAEVFATASSVLGIDVAEFACSGSEAEVSDAFNAQALTVAVSVGVGRELLARGYKPQAIVGFSLGQISALALSGMLSVEQTFALLKERAAGMAQACQEQPGAMCALLKASHEEAAQLCEESAQGQILVSANYNCPGQVVISGQMQAVERAEQAWAAMPGKRAARLNVAGGFHSPLMQAAAVRTGAEAAQLQFNEPRFTLLCNTDAQPFTAAEAAQRLEQQVKSPVMFEQSIAALLQQGASEFIEVGYGNVLVNLVKRQDRSTCRTTLGTAAELDAYLTAQGDE